MQYRMRNPIDAEASHYMLMTAHCNAIPRIKYYKCSRRTAPVELRTDTSENIIMICFYYTTKPLLCQGRIVIFPRKSEILEEKRIKTVDAAESL